MTPTAPGQAEIAVAAYLVSNLRSGEPSLCFEDERGDYGDEDHTPVFDELVLKSDHEAQLSDLRAEVERLREALLLARDHIDMSALRISHCKDAAAIDAALAATDKGGGDV